MILDSRQGSESSSFRLPALERRNALLTLVCRSVVDALNATMLVEHDPYMPETDLNMELSCAVIQGTFCCSCKGTTATRLTFCFANCKGVFLSTCTDQSNL